MDSVVNWVLKVKTLHFYQDWEQLLVRKPMGPVVETSFPSAGVPSRAAISSSLGNLILLFKSRKRISSEQQLGFQTWHLFRAAIHKNRKLILDKLGGENVLEVPETDVEAVLFAFLVRAFGYILRKSLANVWPL